MNDNQFLENDFRHSEMITKSSMDVIQTIANQISQGKIQIKKNPKPFRLMNNFNQNATMKLLEKLQSTKMKTEDKLQELQREEEDLRKKINSNEKSNSKSQEHHKTNKQKSQFPQQEKEIIKEILKKQRERQKMEKQKHERILQSYQQKIINERENEKKQIQRIKTQHNQSIEAGLLEIQQRKMKRKEFYEQSKRRVKLLKSMTYAHKRKEQEDEEKKKQNIVRNHKILEQLRNKSKLNFSEILEHQKKMLAFEKQMQEKSKQRIRMASQLSENRLDKKQSRMSKILQEEDQARRQEQKSKERRKKEVYERMKNFGKNVRENFQPKSQQKKEEQSLLNGGVIKNKVKKVRALSTVERKNQGDNYLLMARKLKKISTENSTKRIQSEPETTTAKYHNYLQNLKRARKNDEEEAKKKLNNLLKSENYLRQEQRLQKAAQIIKKQQNKNKNNGKEDEKLLQAIFNKISILKALS